MDNIIVGLKQSKKAVEANEVKLAYIAKDADYEITAPVLRLCNKKDITINREYNMKDLAKLCKIEVPTAIAVVTI